MVWKGERQRHSTAKRGVRTRKDQSPNMKNLKMNNDVYKIRRKVIDIIYHAKELADLPYILVRITDKHDRIIGQASMKDYIIWIPVDTVEGNNNDLQMTVYHELLHTVYKVPHIKGCPLMDAIKSDKKLRKIDMDDLFVQYTIKYKDNYKQKV